MIEMLLLLGNWIYLSFDHEIINPRFIGFGSDHDIMNQFDLFKFSSYKSKLKAFLFILYAYSYYIISVFISSTILYQNG